MKYHKYSHLADLLRLRFLWKEDIFLFKLMPGSLLSIDEAYLLPILRHNLFSGISLAIILTIREIEPIPMEISH